MQVLLLLKENSYIQVSVNLWDCSLYHISRFLLRSVYIASVLLGTQLQHAAFRNVPHGFFLLPSSFLIHSTLSLMPFDYG
jgi:hypothetical protein